MKKVLIALVAMVGISLAEVPKIFSVSVKDTSSPTTDLSVIVNTPVPGFLLISYRSSVPVNYYLVDEDTIGVSHPNNYEGSSPTFYQPVNAGEHNITIHIKARDYNFRQINILYIPQRQDEINNIPENNSNTIFTMGYIISNNGGTLYNKVGQEIMSIPSNTKINIKELSHGTYYLKSKTQTTKIIIP